MRAFTLLELIVAVLLFGVIITAAWEMFTQGSRQTADSEALTELVRAQALLDSVLGNDLDRLAVEPGCRPAGIADQGRTLSLYVARRIPGKSEPVVLDPVVYRGSEIQTDVLELRRNDRALPGVRLCSVLFALVTTGRTYRVVARLKILGSLGGWRPGQPPPGTVYQICRAYQAPEQLPGIESWLMPAATLPGESATGP